MSDDAKVKINYSAVFLFLLVCLFIYTFYRPEGTLINILLADMFPSDSWLNTKQLIRSVLPLNEILIYSLPGGLWVFSSTVLARKLQVHFFSKRINLEWLPLCFALWLEFWQYFGVIQGRFDIIDVLMVVVFSSFALVAYKPMQFQQQLLFSFSKRTVAFTTVFICVFMGHVF